MTIQLTGDAPDPISSTVVLDITGQPRTGRHPDQPGRERRAHPRGRRSGHPQRQGHRRAPREKDGKHDNIGFWLDSRVQVAWPVRVGKPGRYTVHARVASTDASTFTIEVGDQNLAAATPSTGSYDTFTAVVLGELNLQPARPP